MIDARWLRAWRIIILILDSMPTCRTEYAVKGGRAAELPIVYTLYSYEAD